MLNRRADKLELIRIAEAVALEKSTRKELWPIDQIQLLPKPQQLIALGGKFDPPKGFPFNTK